MMIYDKTASAPHKEFMVSDDRYKYVQIGYLMDNNDQRMMWDRYVKVPVEVPYSGTATYKGDIILDFTNQDDNKRLRTELGKMEMNTNFGDKTLTFAIDSPSHKASLPGVINYPSTLYFNEKDDKSLGSDTYTGLSGAFAGPNVEEVHGSYIHSNFTTKESINGVFAGKQE